MAKKEKEDQGDKLDHELCDAVAKEIGKETIRIGIDSGTIAPIDAISTRSPTLDLALGVGGVPCGRIIEIFGPEGSGKTTLALSVIAESQRNGGTAAFIDAEHAIDPSWCRRLGVKTQEVIFSQPDSAEQVFKLIGLLLKIRKPNVIVIDSVAALATELELAGEVGDKQYPELARLMNVELRRLKGVIHKSNTCCIFINQIREKLNSQIPGQTNTPGGRALKFYSSQRLDIRRTGGTKQGSDIVGSEVTVKVVKNKVAPPFRTAKFNILYDRGISKPHELVSLGIKYKIIERNGSWVNYNEQRLGLGEIAAGNLLAENPDMAKEIEAKIQEKVLPEMAEAKPMEDEIEDA